MTQNAVCVPGMTMGTLNYLTCGRWPRGGRPTSRMGWAYRHQSAMWPHCVSTAWERLPSHTVCCYQVFFVITPLLLPSLQSLPPSLAPSLPSSFSLPPCMREPTKAHCLLLPSVLCDHTPAPSLPPIPSSFPPSLPSSFSLPPCMREATKPHGITVCCYQVFFVITPLLPPSLPFSFPPTLNCSHSPNLPLC